MTSNPAPATTAALRDADTLRWQIAPLTTLDARAVHALLMLRSRIFVVEQACTYLDPDPHDTDGDAQHLLAWHGHTLVACARVLPPGATFACPSIGRLAVASPWRGRGLGHALLARAIALAASRWPGASIALAAQAHLLPFYASAGFVAIGAPYDEDGIPHVDMQRAPSTEPDPCP